MHRWLPFFYAIIYPKVNRKKSPAKYINTDKSTCCRLGFLLFSACVFSFLSLFSYFHFANPAFALVADVKVYQKGQGDQLLPGEWNNLLYDFVDARGDKMIGTYSIEGKLGINELNPQSQLVINFED